MHQQPQMETIQKLYLCGQNNVCSLSEDLLSLQQEIQISTELLENYKGYQKIPEDRLNRFIDQIKKDLTIMLPEFDDIIEQHIKVQQYNENYNNMQDVIKKGNIQVTDLMLINLYEEYQSVNCIIQSKGEEIQQQIENYQICKEQLEKNQNSTVNKQLKDLYKKCLNLPYQFDIKDNFMELWKNFEKMQEMTNKQFNTKEIQEILNSIDQSRFEKSLIEELTRKVKIGDEFSTIIKEIIKKDEISETDYSLIFNLIQDLRNNKISVDEEEMTQIIENGLTFIKELVTFIQLQNQASQNQDHLPSIQEMLLVVRNNLCEKPFFDKYYRQIETLLQNGGNIYFYDLRFYSIWQEFYQIIWNNQVEQILSQKDFQISIQELEKYYKDGQKLKLNNVSFNQIANIALQWEKIKSTIFKIEELNNMMTVNYQEIDNLISQVIQDISKISKQVQLQQQIKDIKQIQRKTTSGIQLNVIYDQQIQQQQKVNITRIEEIFNNKQNIEYFPTYYQYLTEAYNVKKIFDNNFTKLNNKFTQQLSQMSSIPKSQQIQINSQKNSIEQIQQLLNQLNRSEFDFDMEIKQIEQQLDLSQQTQRDINKFFNLYKIEYKKDTINFGKQEIDDIQQQIPKLRSQLFEKCLIKIENQLEKLYQYEISFNIITILTKNKNNTFKNIQKYVSICEKNIEYFRDKEYYFDLKQLEKELKDVLQTIQDVQEKSKNLEQMHCKNDQKPLYPSYRKQEFQTKEQIQKIFDQIESYNGRINLSEEGKFINQLQNDFSNLEKLINQLIIKNIDNKKFSEKEITQLKKLLKTIPIIPEQEQEVFKVINIYETINKEYKSFETQKFSFENNPSLTVQLVELIQDKYKESLVTNSKVEDLIDHYEQSKTIVTELQNELELQKDETIEFAIFQQLIQIFEQIDQLFRGGSAYDKIEKEIWVKFVTYIEQKKEIFNYDQLKITLKDGYKILKKLQKSNSQNEIKASILNLEEIISEIEQFFKKCQENQWNINIDTQFLGFIDLSENLLEFKTLYQNGNVKVLQLENVVQRPYDNLYSFSVNPTQPAQYKEIQIQPQLVIEEEIPAPRDLSKRQIKPTSNNNDFVYFEAKPKQASQIEEEPIVRKIIEQPSPQTEEQGTISDSTRNLVKAKFLDKFKLNPVFKNREKAVTNIENQLFGTFVKNKDNYIDKYKNYLKLFALLVKYPNISKNIQDKNFDMVRMDKVLAKQDDLKSLEDKIIQRDTVKEKEQAPKPKVETTNKSSVVNQYNQFLTKKIEIAPKFQNQHLNMFQEKKKEDFIGKILEKENNDKNDGMDFLEALDNVEFQDRKKDDDEDRKKKKKHKKDKYQEQEEKFSDDEKNFKFIDIMPNEQYQDPQPEQDIDQGPVCFDPDKEDIVQTQDKMIIDDEEYIQQNKMEQQLLQEKQLIYKKSTSFKLLESNFKYRKEAVTNFELCSHVEYDHLKKFPKLKDSQFNLSNITDFQPVIQYIQSKYKHKEILIFHGWLQASNQQCAESEKRLQMIETELNKTNKCTGIKQEYCTINIFTSQILKDNKCGFYIPLYNGTAKKQNTKLVIVCYMKKAIKEKITEFQDPQFICSYESFKQQEQEEIQKEKQREKLIKRQQEEENLSEITDEEDEPPAVQQPIDINKYQKLLDVEDDIFDNDSLPSLDQQEQPLANYQQVPQQFFQNVFQNIAPPIPQQVPQINTNMQYYQPQMPQGSQMQPPQNQIPQIPQVQQQVPQINYQPSQQQQVQQVQSINMQGGYRQQNHNNLYKQNYERSLNMKKQ